MKEIMDIQWLDQFLYKSAKVRYSIITGIFIVIGFICYFLVILPAKEQLDNALYEQETLKNNIALITQKIASYPTHQQLLEQIEDFKTSASKNFLSIDKQLSQISQQLLASPLKLIDFDNQNAVNQWQFRLQGRYIDFINFFAELAELKLNSDICYLSIHQQKEVLDFSLCLQNNETKEE